MTASDVVAMTTFKRTPKGVRLIDDRGALVVEWRDGCRGQPNDHATAAAEALRLIRERCGRIK